MCGQWVQADLDKYLLVRVLLTPSMGTARWSEQAFNYFSKLIFFQDSCVNILSSLIINSFLYSFLNKIKCVTILWSHSFNFPFIWLKSLFFFFWRLLMLTRKGFNFWYRQNFVRAKGLTIYDFPLKYFAREYSYYRYSIYTWYILYHE